MKKILLGLVVCAGFCACSNDDVVVSNTATPAIEGEGYVSFAINMPTTSATRAANDVYDDGLASEYYVNDATLLLFAGTSESTAAYYASYSLTTDFQAFGSTTDNITTRSQLTQLISTPVSGDIYALVVLNANGLLNNIEEGATLTDLQTTALQLGDVSAMNTTGFFMCNAVLTSTPGGSTVPAGSGVTTLAKIDESMIFTTAAEAESHPATEIYVERGMAKVTVLDNAGEVMTGTDIPVTIEGFVLDNTNTYSYLVRNTTSSDLWWDYTSGYATNYRMAGDVAVATGLYRTYWATDPNYDEDSTYDYTTLTSLKGTTPSLGNIGADYPQYCLENTFAVRNQNQNETTRAIIAAELYGGDDFYVWDNDKTTVYTDLDDVKALILSQLKAEGYMEEAETMWVGPSDAEKESNPDLSSNLYDYITIVFDNEESLTASDDLTFTYTVSGDVNVDWFVDPATGDAPTTLPAALVATTDEYAAVVADLNSHHEVAYYEGGISYYPVLIEHFGDALTYWSEDYAATTGTSNEQSYPDGQWGQTAEQNWLGRYGVLRNNWYELNVTGVNKIGSATVPEAYGNPDDPTEQWISLEINILSWAKRTQDVTL